MVASKCCALWGGEGDSLFGLTLVCRINMFFSCFPIACGGHFTWSLTFTGSLFSLLQSNAPAVSAQWGQRNDLLICALNEKIFFLFLYVEWKKSLFFWQSKFLITTWCSITLYNPRIILINNNLHYVNHVVHLFYSISLYASPHYPYNICVNHI